MKCVVKRKGHEEKWDDKKLYASCYAACYEAEMNHKQCERHAQRILKALKKRLKNKGCVDSHLLRDWVHAELKKVHKEAAFLYKTHLDVN